jgi:tetratricopeptide (TPR) repeat protein
MDVKPFYFLPLATVEGNPELACYGRVFPLFVSDLLNLSRLGEARYVYLFAKNENQKEFMTLEAGITFASLRNNSAVKQMKEGFLVFGTLREEKELYSVELHLVKLETEEEVIMETQIFHKGDLPFLPGRLLLALFNAAELVPDEGMTSTFLLPLTTSLEAFSLFARGADLVPSPVASETEKQKGQNMIRESLRLDPSFSRAYDFLFAMAVYRGRTNKVEDSIDICNFLLSIRNDDPQLLRTIGEAWIRLGDNQKALSPMVRALEVGEEDPQFLLRTAWLAETTEGFDLALELYEKVYALDIEKEKVLERIANLALQLNKVELARDRFREATKLHPEAGSTWFGLAQALLRLEEPALEEARKALDLGIEHDPEFWGNYLILSSLYSDAGEHDESEVLYRKAWERNPLLDRTDEDVEAFQEGCELVKNDEEEAGIRVLTDLIRRDPRFWEAHFFLGLLFRQRDELSDSLMHFEAALEITKDHGEIYNELAIHALEDQKYKEAIAYSEKAVELDPENMGYFCNLGMGKLYDGDPDAAEKIFLTAKWREPENPLPENCLQMLGQLRAQMDEPGFVEKMKKVFKF